MLRAPTFYESLAPHWFIPSPYLIILPEGEDKQNSFGITVPKEHLNLSEIPRCISKWAWH